MQIKATILLIIGLLMISIPVFAGPPADKGVTRTPVEGSDNWGYMGVVPSTPSITCPGGELDEGFDCSDSMTGRLHIRDLAGWSCIESSDERMTGVGLYTSNANFDVDSNGPVWGDFKIVPMVGCIKDLNYNEAYEELVNAATSFWYGTWNGKRQYDSDRNVWVGDIKFRAKGVGEELGDLHFKGLMWITTYTPFPVPYEALYDFYPELFDEPEAVFIGEIKE